MNNKMKMSSLLLVLLLSSCNYGYTAKHTMYENSFSPWPSGVEYSSFIDCYSSFFECNYDYTYSYCLKYKSGEKTQYKGYYEYKNECFYLYFEDEMVVELKKANYYQFVETITYEEKEYTIIWHAKHIFD